MPSKRSAFLIQSSFGQNGNFELVFANRRGGFVHFWRDNDSPALTWNGPQLFGCAPCSEPSLLQNDTGPLEVLARTGTRLVGYQRGARWSTPKYFGSNVTGNASVIQAQGGRLHLVVPAIGGGFAYFQREADPDAPWEPKGVFGAGAGQAVSTALMQANFGDPGNLEMIAVMTSSGASLAHWWQSDSGTWHGPNQIQLSGLPPGTAATGVPAFMQSRHGNKGHFEVVVPLTTGGLAHFTRDNDSSDLHWNPPKKFGSGPFNAATMIQSAFGSPGLGNFELVGRVANRVEHYWCDDATLTWNGPTEVIYTEPLAADPTVAGEWRIAHMCEPVGIHAALLNTNKILFFAYEEHDQTHGESSVFDLDTGAVEHVPQDEDLFCAGHAFLPDGRVLVAGGHVTGEKTLFLFTPSGNSGSWQQLPDMPQGRWYPTCTTLPDGTIFVISGAKKTGGGPVNDSYQIYHPVSGLGPEQPAPFLNEAAPCNTYPWVYVLPSGKLFIFASHLACFFDLATKTFGSERMVCKRGVPRTYPLEGTSVLLPLLPDSTPPYRSRVLVIGGGGLPPDTHTPATDSCEIIDLNDPNPQWNLTPPMSSPRVMPDSVLLPDGTVVVMNGSSEGKADDAINPVYKVDIYNPATNTWLPVDESRIPRLYHSTALLLPDGTVMTAGLDEAFNPEPFHYPEYRLEIFHPPYLFRGPRPQLESVPATMAYGTQFTVQCSDGTSIESAALMRAGSSTHSFNMDQRHVGLRIASRTATTVTLEAPPNGNVAPPGYYLLFLLNGQGVPSVGKFTQL